MARAISANGSSTVIGADVELGSVAFEAQELAAKAAAAFERALQLDLGLEAGEALVILAAQQRPVDAGRADFEHISGIDRIRDVEQRRDRVADRGAILHRHRGVVDALGHDLQGRALRRR